MKHYFCFGKNEIDYFKKYKINVENFYPVGSLKAGIARSLWEESKVEYDICLMSSGTIEACSNRNRNEPAYVDFYEGFNVIVDYLKRFKKESNFNICIQLRYKKGTCESILEKEYYQSIFENNVEIIENDSFASYLTGFNSKLIIGSGTTILSELFGYGKKVMYFDYSVKKEFSYHKDLILSTKKEFKVFKNIIINLLNEDYTSYNKRTKSYQKYLMSYDEYDFPQNIIKKYINKIAYN